MQIVEKAHYLMLSYIPNPQVVLCGLHEIRDIATISAVSSHDRRHLRIAIPQLYIV